MNRNQIKWAPFESLYHGQDIIHEIETVQNRITMPTKSEDELIELQENILNAWHTASLVKIKYFKKGKIFFKTSIIQSIQSQKIYFEDHTSLYFEQILEIHFT